MSIPDKIVSELRSAIDDVEEAYEFMLAYAAQGRQTEADTSGESQIRGFLERFRAGLDIFSDHAEVLLPDSGNTSAYSAHFTRDTETMKSILDMLIARSNITSDMIDNTNGMIAVRSFLTNMFFVDQVLLPMRGTIVQ